MNINSPCPKMLRLSSAGEKFTTRMDWERPWSSGYSDQLSLNVRAASKGLRLYKALRLRMCRATISDGRRPHETGSFRATRNRTRS